MLKKFAFLVGLMTVSVLLLSGCAKQIPKEVKIPVAVPCPKPNLPDRPHLPIEDLKSDSPSEKTIKAYAASIAALQGYAKELEEILKGYGE